MTKLIDRRIRLQIEKEKCRCLDRSKEIKSRRM